MKILLTGATGFVGTRMLATWRDQAELVPISLRNEKSIIEKIDWQGITQVIHLAGLAHQMDPVPDNDFFEANEHLTIALAEVAKTNGVKHFMFMSTTKVYGDQVEFMSEETPCNPADAYGKSKLNAENRLLQLMDTSFTVSIVRSPLIIGPGAKGNLLRLMELAKSNLPLPLAGINNQRSMINLDNLVDFFTHLTRNPIGGTFLISEPKPISTSNLIRSIRGKMGFKSPRLFSIPQLFRFLIKKLRPNLHSRLFGSSVIDNTKTREKLNFNSRFTLNRGIEKMVEDFKLKK